MLDVQQRLALVAALLRHVPSLPPPPPLRPPVHHVTPPCREHSHIGMPRKQPVLEEKRRLLPQPYEVIQRSDERHEVESEEECEKGEEEEEERECEAAQKDVFEGHFLHTTHNTKRNRNFFIELPGCCV